jgi:CheY-like chemotaxis protein
LIKSFGKIPLMRGNGGALGQVFLNLLVNAAQAIPEGDAERNEIRVATWVDAGRRGSQGDTGRGPELVVEISDSGSGIAPEVLSHLFEPFFTTKPMGQGTGLGLSISRRTVIDHGGRVTVDSQVGKGSVFRVFLPVDDAQIPSQPVTATASPAALPRGRVLVIDDEPLIGRIIRTALSNQHDVLVVHRASEALARLEQGETFDLVLCDVVMPDLGGPEFFDQTAKRWPQLVARVVFMTGGAFTPRTLEFVQRVPNGVLRKPFTVDRLRRLVCEQMGG